MIHIGKTIATAFVLALLAVAPAHAIVVAESGDAGDNTATAQDVGGSEVTGITGSAPEGDADVFKFTFLDGVVFQVGNLLPDVFFNFSVDVIHLVLQDENGTDIVRCDDCWLLNSGQVTTVINQVLSAGVYFLMVQSVVVAAFPLGDYSMDIAIRERPVGDAPEPATLALIGLGLAGLGLARRRRG